MIVATNWSERGRASLECERERGARSARIPGVPCFRIPGGTTMWCAGLPVRCSAALWQVTDRSRAHSTPHTPPPRPPSPDKKRSRASWAGPWHLVAGPRHRGLFQARLFTERFSRIAGSGALTVERAEQLGTAIRAQPPAIALQRVKFLCNRHAAPRVQSEDSVHVETACEVLLDAARHAGGEILPCFGVLGPGAANWRAVAVAAKVSGRSCGERHALGRWSATDLHKRGARRLVRR